MLRDKRDEQYDVDDLIEDSEDSVSMEIIPEELVDTGEAVSNGISEEDANLITAITKNNPSLTDFYQLGTRLSDCDICWHFRERTGEKPNSCTRCGYCILEELNLISDTTDPDKIAAENSFVNMLKSSNKFIASAYQKVKDCELKEEEIDRKIDQYNKDTALLKCGTYKMSEIYRREIIYKKWASEKPRKPKAYVARQLGICVRQVNRDLERFGIDLGLSEI